MPSFIDLPLPLDPAQRIQDAFDAMSTRFPGWVANEGNLEVAVLEETALMANETALTASQASEGIFRFFGESLLGLAAEDGRPATALVQIAAIDTQGYTLPANTQVGYRAAGDELWVFTLDNDAVIPPDPIGGNVIVTGIPVTSIDLGADRNGILAGSVLPLIDAYSFVESVTLTTDTSGGVDEESDDAYLDRLHDYLQLLAPRPILADDFAAISRQVSGVYRATALDGYSADDGTSGNERTVTVFAVDSLGNPVSAAVQADLLTYLQARREVNFSIFVAPPSYATIQVSYSVTSTLDQDPAALQATVTAELQRVLSPTVYGGGDQVPPGWDNQPTIRIFDLVAVIMNLDGVAHVDGLTINGAQADYPMPGPAPLPAQNPLVTGGVT